MRLLPQMSVLMHERVLKGTQNASVRKCAAFYCETCVLVRH